MQSTRTLAALAPVGALAPPHETECSNDRRTRRSMSFRRSTGPSPRYGASATPTARRRARVDDPPSPLGGFVSSGQAGGSLSGFTKALLVDTGLVSEPRVETSSDFLSLEVQNAPPGNYDISVNAVLALQTVPIPVSMTIHVVDTQVIYADPLVGKRTAIYR